jgi:hypothetical protein
VVWTGHSLAQSGQGLRFVDRSQARSYDSSANCDLMVGVAVLAKFKHQAQTIYHLSGFPVLFLHPSPPKWRKWIFCMGVELIAAKVLMIQKLSLA